MLNVLAAPGVLVPKEGDPRAYYTDTPPAGEIGYAVEETAYVLRRIADGDLVVVPASVKKGGA